MFKYLLSKIDKIICLYLGLDKEESNPDKVHKIGHQLLVRHTTSFKRHVVNSTWKDITDVNAEKMEKLGQQAGQVVANQLVITFKEPTIRINTNA